jgi:hypothetical protein
VYHLSVDELKQECLKRGLDSGGPMLVLRRRLADHIKGVMLEPSADRDAGQASAATNNSNNLITAVHSTPGDGSHGGGADGQISVLVDLLRGISPLASEEPEAILQLFVRLGEGHELGLVEDRVFMARVLPLVSGTLLKVFGECLRSGVSWKDCMTRLLIEYFPYFV